MEENTKINIDDFKKIEIKVGEILSAEKVENADKLLKLEVSFGTEKRQIVSGIAEFYPNPVDLIGLKVPFVTNLESRTIKGLESNGMIMAALDREGGNFSLPKIDSQIPAGTRLS
jgi:methionyl-tRNA synthetase